MAKTGYAQRIRSRVNELRTIIAEAQAELDELEVAERVLERLAADQTDDPDDVGRVARRTKEPTIADMAVRFLSEVGPMATPDLLSHMRANWREDLADTTLTSTLSRTKHTGRIGYADGKWFAVNDDAPEENEAAAATSEANAESADDTPGVHRPQPSPTEAHGKEHPNVASRFES
jgi:hypothetical protein